MSETNNLGHRISDTSSTALYSLNAGRDAFKNTPLTDMSRNDTEELRRQSFAIRSFTQSIEMDLPPAPELPATLDIDHYGYPIDPGDSGGDNISIENGMTSSSTVDTIVEVIKNADGEEIDPTLGETQKYIMQVPAPGLTEQEMEMHKSLMKHEDAGDDSDTELKLINDSVTAAAAATRKISSPIPPTTKRHPIDKEHHDPLRREYSNAAKQRPRPTTPTQKCTLESYVSEQEKAPPPVSAPVEKIKINIPRKSLKGRQPEDFYQSMSNQMPPQSRQYRSNSNYSNGGDYDDDVDIIEQNPEYKDKAPKAPVVHRRTSIEWEAFDESIDRTPMADTKDDSAAPPTTTTPPTTPGKSPTDNGKEKLDEFKKAAEKMEAVFFKKKKKQSEKAEEELNLKKQTADAFAEELFGKNDDDWANQAGSSATTIPIHQPSTDDPIFGIDQSEEPGIEEIPEVSLSHRGSRRESRRESHPEVSKLEGHEGEHGTIASETENANIEPGTDEQPTTDIPAEGGTDTTAATATDQYYDYSAYGYDPNYANYDPSQTDQEQAAYDPNAAYNYDQATYTYDQNGAYDYSQQYGYDQTGAYNQEYPGYDTTAYDYGTVDPNAAIDTSAYDYGTVDPNVTAPDPATTDYSSYTQDTTEAAPTTDYSGYDQNAAATYNPFAAAAAEDSAATGTYDYNAATSAYGDTSTTYTDPATAQAPDYSSYDPNNSSNNYYDTTQYGGGYQYGDTTTDYSQYGYPADPQTQSQAATEAPYEQPQQQPSQFSQPLFPSMKAHDPYAWDTQDTTAASSAPAPAWDTHDTAAASSAPAPPSAPPSRPAPPAARQAETPTEIVTPVHRAPPPRPGAPPTESAVTNKPSRPPPPSPQPARPPPPSARAAATPVKQEPEEEEEEDAWAKFNKMTEKVSNAVKSTKEKIEEISGQSAADDIHDESYLSNVGGSQGMMTPAVMRQMQQLEEEKKKLKADKKKAKHMKRPQSPPEVTAKQEMDMDKAAAELAARIAATRAHDLGDWKPPSYDNASSPQQTTPHAPAPPPPPPPPSAAAVPKKEESEEKVEEVKNEEKEKEKMEEKELTKPELPSNWAAFGESTDFSNAALPNSDSDFFTLHLKEVPPAATDDPFAPPKPIDPFAPQNGGDDFDPFDIKPAEDIVAQAKERANLIAQREDQDQDIDYLHPSSNGSTPTPEGGSPVSSRPVGFEDEFKPAAEDSPTPLYDEDDSVPLTEFPKKFTGEGWDLMIRYPPKKKIMADRYWKPCFVRIKQNMLYIYNSKTDDRPMQEIMLQPTYSLSDATLQAYDVYGKIHTVKLQYVQYKERIGIRSGQIARLVEGHITKYGMPIEHAAQVTILSKFGCLNSDELSTFINAIEDFLFTSKISREIVPQYKQDEVQIHCYDEYQAYVDKEGFVSNQQARVRMFCLAFVSGSPVLEIGLNDRRRQGKEIVRRKDILPMYTERWIRFENLDFHCTVDKKSFEEEQVVRLSPPDGTFIEICRFRVRPPKNREKPLIVKSLMKIAGSKIEIRIDAMVAAHQQRAKGTNESIRTIPCEDIVIRFPIPEAWIYIFREERHWGVGSVHSKTRRPGKVKNLKDKILGAVQQTESTLIEVAIGEAKYEHVFRALVWRIPRLPEKHHAAYKVHLLKCRFDLSSFDLMPETFLPTCDVEFTMPLATISNTVVRSVSVEQHEDSDRVEKFVRYVAKCRYQIEVDYVQCSDLDNDAVFDAHVVDPEAVMSKQPEQHKPLFNPEDVDKQHGGYGIEFSESEMGGAPRPRNDSSSEEDEPQKRPVPIIEINMKGYGY